MGGARRTGPSFFISHSSKDREAADELCGQLESRGAVCWIAPRDVTPGEPYGAQIVAGLERSSALVFLLSSSSNASRHVESEVARAFEKGKDIFPVRLEEIKPSPELELFVTSPHWIDAWRTGMAKAAEALIAASRAGGSPRPGAGAGRRGGRRVGILVPSVLLLAMICVFGWAAVYLASNPRERERLRGFLTGQKDEPSASVPAAPVPSPAPTASVVQAAMPVPEVAAATGQENVLPTELPRPVSAPFVPHYLETGDPVMEFVWIPAAGIWAGRYEVTNLQYRRFRPDHWAGRFRGEEMDGDSNPVVRVTAGDAAAFAEWLTRREAEAGRLPAGARLRLPTGEEWMLMAECGDGRPFPWGGEWPPRFGNVADRALARLSWGWAYIDGYQDGYALTAPVKESGANPWEIHGLAGNVWEWTSDISGGETAARGGAWDSCGEESLRCRTQVLLPSGESQPTVGFRLVLEPGPDGPAGTSPSR